MSCNGVSSELLCHNISVNRSKSVKSFNQIDITIVLTNGCFHNGPVMCPRSVIMAQGVCIGSRTIQTSRAIITDRGHITGPL